MDRKESRRRAIQKRNNYLFAHVDSETAYSLINSWKRAGIGKVCEEINDSGSFSESEQIFANSCRNKLTAFGNSVALKLFRSMDNVERACKFAKFDYEDLSLELSHGFASVEQKENFLLKRSEWFLTLKKKMQELRISKEVLESFGLSWKAAKSFAYRTI